MNIQTAMNLAIEDLVDSDFRPGEHEAYAFITDRYTQLSHGRLGGEFLQMINQIDWDHVEETVKRLKEEAGQRNVDQVIDDIEFHANQIKAAMQSVKVYELGGALLRGQRENAISVSADIVDAYETVVESVAKLRENRAEMACEES